MHGFFPRRQNFGSIFKRLERHRDEHGRAPRAIGERQTPTNSPLRSRDTTKVRLSEQSPAKFVKRSLSYSRSRELITHGKNWKLMLSRILTPTQKINHVCRNTRLNSAQRAHLSRRKPPIRPADFNDGEVGWGNFRAANSSNSTVLNETSSSSSFNSSADAEKIRQLMKKKHNIMSRWNTDSVVEGHSAATKIGRQKLGRENANFAPKFLPNRKMPAAADSEPNQMVSNLRLRPDVFSNTSNDKPTSWNERSAGNVTRSAGPGASAAGDQNPTVANTSTSSTTVARPDIDFVQELSEQQQIQPMHQLPSGAQHNSVADNPISAANTVTSRFPISAGSSVPDNVSASAAPKASAVDAQPPYNPDTIDHAGPVYESGTRNQDRRSPNSNPNQTPSVAVDPSLSHLTQQITISRTRPSKATLRRMDYLRQQQQQAAQKQDEFMKGLITGNNGNSLPPLNSPYGPVYQVHSKTVPGKIRYVMDESSLPRADSHAATPTLYGDVHGKRSNPVTTSSVYAFGT